MASGVSRLVVLIVPRLVLAETHWQYSMMLNDFFENECERLLAKYVNLLLAAVE